MTLKVYVNYLSQPCRALGIFLRQNKIPHVEKIVDLMNGEHMTSEYTETVHPFGKVPAINDYGFQMMESIAIFRYLARKYQVPDYWYPLHLQEQARVDEFLEWHHIGARAPLAMYFRSAYLPLMVGAVPDKAKVESWKKKMETALDEIENVWLSRSKYLGGDNLSIADVVGLCEIEQPMIADYDPTVNRPKIAEWLEKVRTELQPSYGEIRKELDKIVNGNRESKL